MQIGGLQKFSLIDYPGLISAVVFTQGCNFRCPYCHNPELVLPELFASTVPEEILFAFLEERIGQLDAVVISGGEPTLQSGLIPFIRKVKALGYKVKLDTNGSNPDVVADCVEEKLLDYVAMDIKAPFEKYEKLTGCSVDLARIKRSIKLITDSGLPFDFRTTFDDSRLRLHDVEAIQDMLQTSNYYDQECLVHAEKPLLSTYSDLLNSSKAQDPLVVA